MKRITNKRVKKKKIGIICLIIGIPILLILGIIIYKVIITNTDVYKDTNILLGSWIYNEDDGKYVFNDDMTYFQYTNRDTSDNYCTGKYEYKYGAKGDKNLTIRQDDSYYYYTLILKEEMCKIMKKEFYDEYEKKMVFGIEKNNHDNIMMINTDNNNIFKIIKVKE